MKTKLLLSTLCLLIFCSAHAQQVWNETDDGDLSDDGMNPSGVFTLAQGDNIIVADQRGNPRDVDFFAFTIPDDMELSELIVENYNGADDVAFIGIDTGTFTDVDFTNPMAGDLLGGASYGTASIGNDILPVMGNLGGADGFTPPLPAGTYTIWLNQTGGQSESTLNFVVNETLSLDNLQTTQNDITIFPNPVRHTISVKSTQDVKEIIVFDVLGKNVGIAKNATSLDISNLTNGIYLARITTLTGTTTKKIIKQ